MAVITVLVTCLPLAGPARSGSVTDKVFVQCAVVQGNGYNWASTLGWLAAQVELVALRARAFEASEPARRAAIDLSCFVGSSSGGFVAAVMDNLLSNGRVRDGAAVPDGRLLNGEEALEVSRALLFLAMSSNFDGEKPALFFDGIGARLGLLDRASNATGRRWWRPGASAPANIRTFDRWVHGAQLYQPGWFASMEDTAGVEMPLLAERPLVNGVDTSDPANDAMRRLARAARKVLDAGLEGSAFQDGPVGDGFCITAYALPMEGLARPFGYEALKLVFACNPWTGADLARSDALRSWLAPDLEMTGRILLAEQADWKAMSNVSVREPKLVTQLSGEMASHNGLEALSAFDGHGFTSVDRDADYLMFGGVAGPRMEAWAAAAILANKMGSLWSDGIEADGRIAIFGRTENRNDPGASFAQRVMVEYFTDGRRSGDDTGASRLLERYYAWQDEFCAVADTLEPIAATAFYRIEWNLDELPAAAKSRSQELAAKGYNLAKVQTSPDSLPDLPESFFSRYLFDPNDTEAFVRMPPQGGMACRLGERGL